MKEQVQTAVACRGQGLERQRKFGGVGKGCEDDAGCVALFPFHFRSSNRSLLPGTGCRLLPGKGRRAALTSWLGVRHQSHCTGGPSCAPGHSPTPDEHLSCNNRSIQNPPPTRAGRKGTRPCQGRRTQLCPTAGCSPPEPEPERGQRVARFPGRGNTRTGSEQTPSQS